MSTSHTQRILLGRRSKSADAQRAGHKTGNGTPSGPAASSVFINPKETHPVKLRQFGDKHSEHGNGVDEEVDPVILRIETGEEIPIEGRTRIKSRQM